MLPTTVLNELFKGVKRRNLPQEVSLEMSGSTQRFRDVDAGVTYRLFENAIVNTRGSFYQHPIDHWQRLPHEIGSFTSGSRSARALILLHELTTNLALLRRLLCPLSYTANAFDISNTSADDGLRIVGHGGLVGA
jgi:hypothetical protein